MAKRLTFIALTITGLAGLAAAIWQARRHWVWLGARGLDGPVFLALIFLGIFALIIPLHLRGMWERITPLGMVREFAVRGGLMLGTVTAVIIILVLIAFIISIPASWERPYLILPALLLLLPIVLSVIDIFKGIIQRTPANLFWGYLKYSFETYYILLVQFGTIPIAFVLFPAGFFLQIISLIEGGIRLFSDKAFDSLPLLCEWTNVGASACAPTLVTFHIGHLILAGLGVVYGQRLLDKAADGYAVGLEWLEGQIEY